jgi:alpha-glucosidase
MPIFLCDKNVFLSSSGDSPKSLISSYTALNGRMKPLPQWVGNGAVLGLQGGTEAVRKTLQQVEEEWSGNHSDVAAIWLQDWTGQRQLGGKNDLSRVGLWWNWEVRSFLV